MFSWLRLPRIMSIGCIVRTLCFVLCSCLALFAPLNYVISVTYCVRRRTLVQQFFVAETILFSLTPILLPLISHSKTLTAETENSSRITKSIYKWYNFYVHHWNRIGCILNKVRATQGHGAQAFSRPLQNSHASILSLRLPN